MASKLIDAQSPWWRPDKHGDRHVRLMTRGRIKSALRAWFESQGFTEVEPACLQVSPGNEAHLHAFKTELIGSDGTRLPRYLHTSPEFAMKKLLAAGETKIFAFAPCFRNREHSALHANEFMMLEWYRAGDPYETLWADCAAILNVAADVAHNNYWTYKDRVCDAHASFERLTVNDAFSRYAKLELADTYSAKGGNRDALVALALANRIKFSTNDSWSDIFSRILTAHVEPRLGSDQPTLLYEYPICEAALARPVAARRANAERFELYCCGVEIANGFGELTDPAEQRRRFEAEMTLKSQRYGERHPIDEDFLTALAHMPPASGCALGFDRLVMLATGAKRVDDVIWTPSQ
jgi:elongation factor P--(R)-beta-lysine ligase